MPIEDLFPFRLRRSDRTWTVRYGGKQAVSEQHGVVVRVVLDPEQPLSYAHFEWVPLDTLEEWARNGMSGKGA